MHSTYVKMGELNFVSLCKEINRQRDESTNEWNYV